MNRLDLETQTTIISALAEDSSIRSVGAHRRSGKYSPQSLTIEKESIMVARVERLISMSYLERQNLTVA